MDYRKHYAKLISTRINLKREKSKVDYYESHHIIPRCLGGSDDKDNLILLTAREHFIAHRLLNKMYPGEKGLLWAVLFLCGKFSKSNDTRITNRVYEKLRRESSEQRIKQAEHEDCLPIMMNFKVKREICNTLRPVQRMGEKISKRQLTSINLLLGNLIGAAMLDCSLTYPRSRSLVFSNKKVSVHSILRAEEILLRLGYIESVLIDSTSPLAKRKRCKVTPSGKLLLDFEACSVACKEEMERCLAS